MARNENFAAQFSYRPDRPDVDAVAAVPRPLPPALGVPRNTNVPSFPDVRMSIAPSLFRSTARIVDPAPERLWTNSGTNSAPPGAFALRTERKMYSTGAPMGSGST